MLLFFLNNAAFSVSTNSNALVGQAVTHLLHFEDVPRHPILSTGTYTFISSFFNTFIKDSLGAYIPFL